MRIRCKTIDVLSGKELVTSEEIGDLTDYVKLRSAVVHTSKAWFNDVQIVNRGYIVNYAYNKEQEITDYLLGNLTIKELNDVINPDAG